MKQDEKNDIVRELLEQHNMLVGLVGQLNELPSEYVASAEFSRSTFRCVLHGLKEAVVMLAYLEARVAALEKAAKNG